MTRSHLFEFDKLNIFLIEYQNKEILSLYKQQAFMIYISTLEKQSDTQILIIKWLYAAFVLK